MIISRTPLRISFVGGGSDIKSYYRNSPGGVISTAINKYIYITVNKKFDNKIRASYSRTEIVDEIPQLQHALIKECMKLVGIKGGIEITSISDIPSEGTGLGSSSSYVVGLLHALYAFAEKHVTAKRLAEEACKIEIDILKKPIGKQDQYIAAYGGFRYFQFDPDGTVDVNPIIYKTETKKKLESKLLLLYTGLTRSADAILAKQTENLKKNKEKKLQMDQLVKLTKKMRADLNKNHISAVGELLDRNWTLKKEMAEGITSPKIDQWYETARKNGAIGGKILGAGGGGFLLLYAPIEKHKNILLTLPQLKRVNFHFEPHGSQIIFVSE